MSASKEDCLAGGWVCHSLYLSNTPQSARSQRTDYASLYLSNTPQPAWSQRTGWGMPQSIPVKHTTASLVSKDRLRYATVYTCQTHHSQPGLKGQTEVCHSLYLSNTPQPAWSQRTDWGMPQSIPVKHTTASLVSKDRLRYATVYTCQTHHSQPGLKGQTEVCHSLYLSNTPQPAWSQRTDWGMPQSIPVKHTTTSQVSKDWLRLPSLSLTKCEQQAANCGTGYVFLQLLSLFLSNN